MGNEVEEHGTFSVTARDYCDPPPAPLIDVIELKKWSFYRAVIAEYFGTLVFLYITMITIVGYKIQSDPIMVSDACAGVGFLGIAWSFGGMIFLVVYCTAGISVTFGFLLARKLRLVRAVMCGVAQCLGALCGVGLVKFVVGAIYYNESGGGANLVAKGYSNGIGWGAEIIGTFVLVYVVFSATDPKRRNATDSHVPVLAPLPIGFAVFMVHLATMPITGTGINPARSLATTIVYRHTTAWRDQWIFWVGPFAGAAIAAFYHQAILRGAAVKALGSCRTQALM